MTSVRVRMRNDKMPARRPLLGLPKSRIKPTRPTPINEKLLPATRGHLRYIVGVRRERNRHGVWLWVAYCRAPRCKWTARHTTHNGAHISAALHRREKASTKGHGARELAA